MNKDEYLERFVFRGLTNLNDGFDSEGIRYFSEPEFETVLRRIEELGVGVFGIEPWKNREFYDVRVCEDYEYGSTGSRWFWKAFEDFKAEDRELLYAATFDIPDHKLNESA